MPRLIPGPVLFLVLPKIKIAGPGISLLLLVAARPGPAGRDWSGPGRFMRILGRKLQASGISHKLKLDKFKYRFI